MSRSKVIRLYYALTENRFGQQLVMPFKTKEAMDDWIERAKWAGIIIHETGRDSHKKVCRKFNAAIIRNRRIVPRGTDLDFCSKTPNLEMHTQGEGPLQASPSHTTRMPNLRFFQLTMLQAEKWWNEFRSPEPFPGLNKIASKIREKNIEIISGRIDIQVDMSRDAVIEFIKGVKFNA